MLKRIILIIACVFLFLLSLFHGSVSIPMGEVARALLGKGNDISNTIILANRLPQALTALLAGAALAVSGLLLQTAFRNPLAAPDIFGVTSGASLAVALLTLAPGLVVGGMLSWLSSIAAAFIGAMVVTMIIWFFSRMVRSSVLLIIIGMMIGYFCSSIITLLNSLATEEGVHSFVVWGMGDFTNVGLDGLPLFATLTVLTTLSTLLLVKPLNALLLGPRYAESMGINVKRVRNLLLIVTGLLTAVVTAFCGPVAFIALAVPHVARLYTSTTDHRVLLPTTILMGSAIALLCNVVVTLPADGTVLPLNAVTPLIGVPVIVYVLLKKTR
jgi:iron complex transport system permease protein